MNTRKSNNNGDSGATGGASSPPAAAGGASAVAGGFAAIAQAISAGATQPSPVVTPPTHKRKEPEPGPFAGSAAVSSGTPAPSFANGWSGNRDDQPDQRVKLSPEQRCNRCEKHLDKVTKINKRSGRLQIFGSYSSGVCGGGGVILLVDKNCVFCLRAIKAITVCLSLQTGPGGECAVVPLFAFCALSACCCCCCCACHSSSSPCVVFVLSAGSLKPRVLHVCLLLHTGPGGECAVVSLFAFCALSVCCCCCWLLRQCHASPCVLSV